MTQSSQSDRVGRATIAGFGVVALTVLCAQVVLSRLFAGTLTYYFAFMLISLAMLGLSFGALIVQLVPTVFRRNRLGLQAAIISIAMGLSGAAGTLAMLRIYPRFTVDDRFLVLVGVFWCFLPFFLCGGVVVALVLGHARENFHRVYAVDLVAAALGCVFGIGLLNVATPVEAMVGTVAILPIVAASLFALGGGRPRLALAALAVAVPCIVVGQARLDDPDVSNPPSLFRLGWLSVGSAWDAQSAVHVYAGRFFTWALSPTYTGPPHRMLTMLIDGIGGTQIVEFDGDPASLARYDYLDYDLSHLGQLLAPPDGRQLVVGPGGGVDLLQAVRAGRTDVTAVEINPLVVQLVNREFGGFSGAPYELPGVSVVVDNARTFIKRSTEAWDLVSLTWVDTGGSATALAASENYLYTVEAYQEFFDHLTDDGVFAFMRALGYREEMRIDSMRGVAVAVEALAGRGVEQPGRHLIVASSYSPSFGRAMCFVLVKKTPFTTAQVEVARRFLDDLRFQAIWLPDGSPDPASIPEPFSFFAPTIRETITTDDRPRLYRESVYDIAPTTDDSPFYFVERGGPNREAGAGVAELRTSLVVVATALLPIIGLPLIPLVRRTGRLGGPGWAALAYFSLLGVAFMLVEIELFHVFALVLGNPTLTLAVVLAGLLVFSGIGSLCGRWLAESGPVAIGAAFGLLVVGLTAFLTFRVELLDQLVVLSRPSRVMGTLGVVAPLAFLMGLPMATGMRLVRHRADVVLWGWALNGTFSVIASVAAIYAAIHIGVPATVAIGGGAYVAAAVLIQWFARRPVPDAAISFTAGE